MKKSLTCLMVTGMVQAADVNINGFVSIGAGKTVNEGYKRQPSKINPNIPQGTETKNTFVADPVSNGIYDSTLSFRPDTNYGLQISSNLGDGLAVTGQVTATGGDNFNAVVSWAYATYQFNDKWSILAGRQRLPLFYYSDFIDVGYAYHWIRPPHELVASEGNTLEGLKVRYVNSYHSWDYSAEAYYGGGQAFAGEDKILIKSDHQQGVVLKANNDWFTVRGTWSKADTVIGSPLAALTNQGTEDNPLTYTFMGLATEMQLPHDIFVVSEYSQGQPNNPAFPSIPVGGPAVMEVSGLDKSVGWYVSAGIHFGNVTPHITFSEKTSDNKTPFANFIQKQDAITLGVRWDFHPSAALKFEYMTSTDKSDNYYRNLAGAAGVPGYGFAPGVGYGKPADVDLLAVSLDLVF
jgi:hypothetical protein